MGEDAEGEDGDRGVIAAPQRPRTRKGAASRERILVAASELFAERGYSGTSVESIASEASITVAGMYRHFSSKEQLLMAVAERITRASTARRRLGSSGDLAEDIAGLFAEYLADGERTRRRLSIEMSRAAAGGGILRGQLADFNRLLRRSLERTIAEAPEVADPDPREIELLAHLMLILLMGAIHLDTLDPDRVGDPALIDHLADVIRRLLDGAGPTSAGGRVPAVTSVRRTRPASDHGESDGRRLRGLRTRRRILSTAAELFAFEGYDKTTTERMAEAAGITVPGLYVHFPSKRELLVEVGRETFDAYRLTGSLGGRDEVADNLAELAVAFSSSDDHLSRRLVIELDFGAWRDPSLAAVLRAFHRRVRQNVVASLTGETGPDARAERTALVFLMLFMGIAHLDTVDPELVDYPAWVDLLRSRVPQLLSV